MPNWCYNTLVVSGDKKQLKKFKDYALTKNNCLDTEQFIPYPKKFKDMDKKNPNTSFNLKKNDKGLLVDGLNGYVRKLEQIKHMPRRIEFFFMPSRTYSERVINNTTIVFL